MVATVLIREKNGAGETATDKTSGTVRFKNADNATVDTNNRLIIPTSGQEYSFRKVLRLNISVAPDVDIDNLQAYADGDLTFGFSPNVIGHFVASRRAAADAEAYQNGATFQTVTTASVAPLNLTFYIGGRADGADPPFQPSPEQIAAFHAGSGLSDTEVSNFYSRLNIYLVAVGAA